MAAPAAAAAAAADDDETEEAAAAAAAGLPPSSSSPSSYIDFAALLSETFSATAFANGLLHGTTTTQDVPPLDLSPALSKVLFDIQEVDTHIDAVASRAAVPLLTYTKERGASAVAVADEVRDRVDVLQQDYERLHADVVLRWRRADELRCVVDRMWSTLWLGRVVARALLLGRQLEVQIADLVAPAGTGPAAGAGTVRAAGSTIAPGSIAGGGGGGGGGGSASRSSKKDDHKAMVRIANTLLSLRQMLAPTNAATHLHPPPPPSTTTTRATTSDTTRATSGAPTRAPPSTTRAPPNTITAPRAFPDDPPVSAPAPAPSPPQPPPPSSSSTTTTTNTNNTNAARQAAAAAAAAEKEEEEAQAAAKDLQRVQVIKTLRDDLMGPAEKTVVAKAQQVVREFSMTFMTGGAGSGPAGGEAGRSGGSGGKGSGSGINATTSTTTTTTTTTTYIQTEDTKARTTSAVVTLYLLSSVSRSSSPALTDNKKTTTTTTTGTGTRSAAPATTITLPATLPTTAAATATGRQGGTTSFQPDLLINALQSYLQAALTSSLASLIRALANLSTLDRTLAEISARCQNIVALEALLAGIRPPGHPLLRGTPLGPPPLSADRSDPLGGDTLGHAATEDHHDDDDSDDDDDVRNNNLLLPLLQSLDASSLPSHFWRSLASSLTSRLDDILLMNRSGGSSGGASAGAGAAITIRSLRANRDRIRDGIRQCVLRGFRDPTARHAAGGVESGKDSGSTGMSGGNREREVAVMLGAVLNFVSR
ncbi:MAG: hypothetical protein M1815_000523 [Lichina confinis]|nr:MAG: hypothetical protein M1815_000523 [Lichina confinis]